jgi:prolyl oligopeptidase
MDKRLEIPVSLREILMISIRLKYALAAVLNVGTLLVCAQKVPVSRTEDFRETFHGHELIDPYHWLEQTDATETRNWIDEQNAYAHGLINAQAIRPQILKRLTAMAQHDHIGAPLLRNGYYYFSRRGANQDLWSFYRRGVTATNDELLLDPHQFGPAGTSISIFGVSDDGSTIAFGVRKGGQDETDLRVFDVANHRELPDRFPLSLYRGFAFRKDGKSFYYTVENRESGQRVLYHPLGTDIGKDAEVFKQPADTWVKPQVSEDGRYLLINVQHGWSQGEVYVQNLGMATDFNPL